ncbi:MAG: bifunctional riboflavin kinase/FAD synthetase [Gemmatimonadaceae bacterium]
MSRPIPGAPPATLPGGGAIVTVGTFDGVHVGHRDLLARLVARAAASGLRSVLVTFQPHPSEVLKPERAPLLLSPGEEKLELLAETGLDYAAVLPFTRALAELTAEEFVDQVLVPRYGMRELLIGYDHGFGRDRAGSVDVLRRLGARRGFPVEVVPPFQLEGGATVSSTAIRHAISGGDLDAAAAALGRRYAVSGRVTHGDKRGRLLGFPTLNLALASPRKLLPPPGVYAVRAQTPRGAFGGMMNLGPRPTFGDATLSIEAHLFDADGDLYGDHVRLDFVSRLRDTRRFESADALVGQLRQDAEHARQALAGVR